MENRGGDTFWSSRIWPGRNMVPGEKLHGAISRRPVEIKAQTLLRWAVLELLKRPMRRRLLSEANSDPTQTCIAFILKAVIQKVQMTSPLW